MRTGFGIFFLKENYFILINKSPVRISIILLVCNAQETSPPRILKQLELETCGAKAVLKKKNVSEVLPKNFQI